MMKAFKIVGLVVDNDKPCKINQPSFGEVDLKTINDEQAAELVKLGCPFLEAIKTEKPKPSTESVS